MHETEARAARLEWTRARSWPRCPQFAPDWRCSGTRRGVVAATNRWRSGTALSKVPAARATSPPATPVRKRV